MFRKPRIIGVITIAAAAMLCGVVAFFLLKSPAPSPSCSQDFDVIISGAEMLDGSGSLAVHADIGIKDQRIACVGNLEAARAKIVIDARGLTVAPGFIDVHTHIERNVPTNSPFLAANFIRQGVTTLVTGNCGRSFLDIARFFKTLQTNHSQVNVASLIGHNTVRQAVMKQSAALPSKEQLGRMKALVEKAMSDGAFGLSTGLVYVPGTFAKTGEILELTMAVAHNKGLYVSHIRDEGVKGADAIREALAIGVASGVHVHISHFKAQGPTQWGSAQSRLDLLREAQTQGLIVSLDQYPYVASSTGLAVLLPSWLSGEDLGSVRRKLSNPAIRVRVRDEMLADLRQNGWKDYSFARVAYCQSDRSLVGLSIAEITEKRALADAAHPTFLKSKLDTPDSNFSEGSRNALRMQADTIIDLFSRGGAQMVFFDMDEDDVETIMKDPAVMFGSDSSVREEVDGVRPHPRGFGTFPRVLSVYARDKKLFSLEDAVRRMTSLPADTFGISKRGYVRTGYWADLVIFDRSKIQDKATYQEPLNAPVGIRYVLVNGSVVLDGDVIQNAYPGVSIRHELAGIN